MSKPRTLEQFLIGKAARPSVTTWVRHVVEGIDREVDMPAIGVTIPLSEIYDGVAFTARPRLVGANEGQKPSDPESIVHPLP